MKTPRRGDVALALCAALLLFASASRADECRVPGVGIAALGITDEAAAGVDALQAGRRALAAGRNRDALLWLERAASAPGADASPSRTASVRALLALALARLGERERSLASAAEALALEPQLDAAGRYEVRTTLAPVFARYRGRDAARENARAAIAAASRPAETGLAQANLARLETDSEPARNHARLALQSLAAADDPRAPAARLAAAEVLAAGNADDRALADATAAGVYQDSSRTGNGALAADALGVMALARAASRESALEAVDRAVRLAAASDSARLHDWLWLRARTRVVLGDASGALEDYAASTERLRRVRPEVETELADFGFVFRERYGSLYIQYADRLLARAEREADAKAAQAWLASAREAVETAKVAEVADYFRDPCIAREAVRSRLEAADTGAVILYYIPLPDRVVVLLSHRGGIEQHRLAVSEGDIVAMVDDFRRLVEKRSTRQYMTPAKKLYAALLKPVEGRLAALAPRTLVIVPDGALRTVPFSAMHDGKAFVAERYAVAVAPSLTLTDPRALASVKPTALVNGLSVARQGFSSLPSVKDEVDALAEILSARVVLDESFVTQRILEEVERSKAAIVHIASHGQFSSRVEDTFILTYDGRLDIDRLRIAIAAGKTRPEPIEILTLSACQTALGDDRAALGLAGVAVRAGARSALASLWFVNDESTAMLVTEFYRNAVGKRMPRAEALRQAQLSLMADERFNHPAYWGAFLLIGSWL